MWRVWATALIWGLNWPAVKIILGAVSPLALRAAGLSLAAALLAAITIVSGRSLAIARADWRTILIASLLSVAGFNICAVFAQLTMPTSRATILTFTMPIWASLFARIALGERLDRLRQLALAFGAAGLAVLAVPFWPVIRDGGWPVGLLFALGAAIFWAAGTVYMKARPVAADPLAITTWQIGIAAAVCTLAMLAFETPRFNLAEPRVAAAFAYHVVLPQALAYVLWFDLVRRVPASTAGLGTLLIPIFGVAGAVVLLDDRPTMLDLAGFALILAGVLIDQAWRGWTTRTTAGSGPVTEPTAGRP